MILRGQLKANQEWSELVDLFIARDLEAIRSQQEKNPSRIRRSY
jgi:hypothetical protein